VKCAEEGWGRSVRIKKCYVGRRWNGISCVHTIKRRKGNWIGHILLRNCLLKHFVEGKIEGRIKVT